MSRFYPHPPYAEEQPWSRTILTVHVLTRFATTGAIAGLGIHGVRSSVSYLRKQPSPATITPITTPSTSPTATTKPRLSPSSSSPASLPPLQQLLRTTGRSTLVATFLLGPLAVGGRMYGRSGIEWQDRSWRLLANAGQIETDDWTYGGAVLGLIAGVGGGVRGTGVAAVATRLTGAAGLGSVAGTVGYMGWRYGVHGGKRDEAEIML